MNELSSKTAKSSVIVVVLGASLVVRYLESPTTKFSYQNEEYVDQYGEQFGFWDWLLMEDRILGIKYTPCHGMRVFQTFNFPMRTYLEFAKHALTIWFTDDRAFSPDISCQQVFGHNLLYRSKAGICAISFQLDGLLSETELGSIKL